MFVSLQLGVQFSFNMNWTLANESSFVKNRAKLFSSSKSQDETVERKKPSYVNLSCAVSGYSGLNRYDSKARQEIRSRESSRDRLQICLNRSRDTSPSPTKLYSDGFHSAAASRRSAGLILSMESNTQTVTAAANHHSAPAAGQRSKSVDRGYLRQNFLNGYLNTSEQKPPSGSNNVKPTDGNASATDSSLDKDGVSGRGRLRFRGTTVAATQSVAARERLEAPTDEVNKSFIQQRIERLYGPAALARGFFTVKASPLKAKPTKAPLQSISLNNNNESVDEVEATPTRTRPTQCDGEAQPPVFRHLNAEFRQQLTPKTNRSPSSSDKRSDEPALSPPAAADAGFHPPTPSPQMAVTASPSDTSDADVGPESDAGPNSHDVIVNGTRQAFESDKEPLAGQRFLKVLDDERLRLDRRIVQVEVHLSEPTVVSSEELTGKICAAVGKCKLLIAQKFEQFAGLCHKNLTQKSDEPFPTTGEDLAGFWDMVNIQVEHIDSLFGEIEALHSNGWIEMVPEVPPPSANQRPSIRKKSKGSAALPAPRSAKAEEAARAREEARRKMIEDRKRSIKTKKNQESVFAETMETNGDAPSNEGKTEPTEGDL